MGAHTQLDGGLIAAANDNLKLDTGTLGWTDVRSTSTETGFNLSLSYTHKSDAVRAREAEAQAAKEAKEAERRERYEERMPDNLADKLAELLAQGYTGDYPGDNWFTDINKATKYVDAKLTKINKVVQGTPIIPENVGLKYVKVEQVARATVGGGQITVRDEPSLDLSGLNRDPSRALTEETKHDFDHGLDTPFESLDQFVGYSNLVAKKSQDVEDYGLTTVLGERIDRGKSELEKGKVKLSSFFQSLSDKLKYNLEGE